MIIYDYHTIGGTNVVKEYIDRLETGEKLRIYEIREEIWRSGLDAFEKINIRQLRRN